MPSPPTHRLQSVQLSVFSRLAGRIAQLKGPVFPLHVGDTWREPPEGCAMSDLGSQPISGLHRYTQPRGWPPLLNTLANREGVSEDRLIVTPGATGGLSALAAALLEPGDEVLVLAPFWPLVTGLIRTQGGIPVEVPFFCESGEAHPATRPIEARLTPYIGPRTRAIYVNSPNNPTGQVLGPAELSAIAQFAREHDLWIWSDEVYRELWFDRPCESIAVLAPERTISLHSVSKCFGMAGNRCGWMVLPPEPALIDAVRKAGMHQAYGAPTAAQVAGLRAITHGAEWLEETRSIYRQVGHQAAALLGVPAPASGTFLFLDVGRGLDPDLPAEEALHDFLLRCLDVGVILAPGPSCGAAWTHHVRVCTTSVPPDQALEGISRLAKILHLPHAR
jgi:aspartate/methionine/tyrosine aminotransferase